MMQTILKLVTVKIVNFATPSGQDAIAVMVTNMVSYVRCAQVQGNLIYSRHWFKLNKPSFGMKKKEKKDVYMLKMRNDN